MVTLLLFDHIIHSCVCCMGSQYHFIQPARSFLMFSISSQNVHFISKNIVYSIFVAHCRISLEMISTVNPTFQ
jgi:hypothetical protein